MLRTARHRGTHAPMRRLVCLTCLLGLASATSPKGSSPAPTPRPTQTLAADANAAPVPTVTATAADANRAPAADQPHAFRRPSDEEGARAGDGSSPITPTGSPIATVAPTAVAACGGKCRDELISTTTVLAGLVVLLSVVLCGFCVNRRMLVRRLREQEKLDRQPFEEDEKEDFEHVVDMYGPQPVDAQPINASASCPPQCAVQCALSNIWFAISRRRYISKPSPGDHDGPPAARVACSCPLTSIELPAAHAPSGTLPETVRSSRGYGADDDERVGEAAEGGAEPAAAIVGHTAEAPAPHAQSADEDAMAATAPPPLPIAHATPRSASDGSVALSLQPSVVSGQNGGGMPARAAPQSDEGSARRLNAGERPPTGRDDMFSTATISYGDESNASHWTETSSDGTALSNRSYLADGDAQMATNEELAQVQPRRCGADARACFSFRARVAPPRPLPHKTRADQLDVRARPARRRRGRAASCAHTGRPHTRGARAPGS